ncbi:MAG: hypothetical protein HYV28_07805 [Ignavibacteriales bacterium]|nr:hypothetical protein [Ignavibacteriales bacterium]
MLRTFFALFVLTSAVIFAQSTVRTAKFAFGTGIFKSASARGDISSGLQVEYYPIATPDFSLGVSGGYNRITEKINYTRYFLEKHSADDVIYYNTVESHINEKQYDQFHVSAIVEYQMADWKVKPYVFAGAGINSSSEKEFVKNSFINQYASNETIPGYPFSETDPDDYTWGMSAIAGAGIRIPLSEVLSLDLKYKYAVQQRTIDSHSALIGLTVNN